MKEQWKKLDSNAKLIINAEEGQSVPIKIELESGDGCCRRILISLKIFVLVVLLIVLSQIATSLIFNKNSIVQPVIESESQNLEEKNSLDSSQINKLTFKDKVYKSTGDESEKLTNGEVHEVTRSHDLIGNSEGPIIPLDLLDDYMSPQFLAKQKIKANNLEALVQPLKTNFELEPKTSSLVPEEIPSEIKSEYSFIVEDSESKETSDSSRKSDEFSNQQQKGTIEFNSEDSELSFFDQIIKDFWILGESADNDVENNKSEDFLEKILESLNTSDENDSDEMPIMKDILGKFLSNFVFANTFAMINDETSLESNIKMLDDTFEDEVSTEPTPNLGQEYVDEQLINIETATTGQRKQGKDDIILLIAKHLAPIVKNSFELLEWYRQNINNPKYIGNDADKLIVAKFLFDPNVTDFSKDLETMLDIIVDDSYKKDYVKLYGPELKTWNINTEDEAIIFNAIIFRRDLNQQVASGNMIPEEAALAMSIVYRLNPTITDGIVTESTQQDMYSNTEDSEESINRFWQVMSKISQLPSQNVMFIQDSSDLSKTSAEISSGELEEKRKSVIDAMRKVGIVDEYNNESFIPKSEEEESKTNSNTAIEALKQFFANVAKMEAAEKENFENNKELLSSNEDSNSKQEIEETDALHSDEYSTLKQHNEEKDTLNSDEDSTKTRDSEDSTSKQNSEEKSEEDESQFNSNTAIEALSQIFAEFTKIESAEEQNSENNKDLLNSNENYNSKQEIEETDVLHSDEYSTSKQDSEEKSEEDGLRFNTNISNEALKHFLEWETSEVYKDLLTSNEGFHSKQEIEEIDVLHSDEYSKQDSEEKIY